MLTPQMTPEEAVRDLMRDASWLQTQLALTRTASARWLLQQMRRTGSPQAARWIDRRSPRGNEWHILWQVAIDEFGHWRWTQGYFTVLHDDRGPHAFIPLMGGGDGDGEARQLTFVLTPHFLKRYRERMQLPDNLSALQLLRRYMRLNPDGSIQDGGYKHKGVQSYLFATREGSCLGGFCSEDVFLCKTFIAHSMTHPGRQERRVARAQQQRREGTAKMHRDSPTRTLQAARDVIRRAEEAMGKNGVNNSADPAPPPTEAPKPPDGAKPGA